MPDDVQVECLPNEPDFDSTTAWGEVRQGEGGGEAAWGWARRCPLHFQGPPRLPAQGTPAAGVLVQATIAQHALLCSLLPPQAIVVVTAGARCVLSLSPPPGRPLEPLELLLPRRSICILSDEARCGLACGVWARGGWGEKAVGQAEVARVAQGVQPCMPLPFPSSSVQPPCQLTLCPAVSPALHANRPAVFAVGCPHCRYPKSASGRGGNAFGWAHSLGTAGADGKGPPPAWNPAVMCCIIKLRRWGFSGRRVVQAFELALACSFSCCHKKSKQVMPNLHLLLRCTRRLTSRLPCAPRPPQLPGLVHPAAAAPAAGPAGAGQAAAAWGAAPGGGSAGRGDRRAGEAPAVAAGEVVVAGGSHQH